MVNQITQKVTANKEDAIPVIVLPDNEKYQSRSPARSGTPVEKASTSASDRLKNKLKGKIAAHESKKPESSKGLQDRMMELMLQNFIPPGESDPDPITTTTKGTDPPPFSVGAMSTNFRRFNARIGPVFSFQKSTGHLFSWTSPSQTLSLLSIYSFICLDPYTLTILPLAIALYFIMLPSFLTRHPPPPVVPLKDLYPLSGPPLAPAGKIRPAPELSRAFFGNMRDIQNSMEDFCDAYDFFGGSVAPVTDFSDEQFSSVVFILFFGACLALFLVSHLVPWRFVALLSGWALVGSKHPKVASWLEKRGGESSEEQADLLREKVRVFARKDVCLNPEREGREVEVFELQYRPLYSSLAAGAPPEWTPMMFSPVPYTPLSPSRIAGHRPGGAKLFEDVKPPEGWKWADKKWSLDLLAREWVEERLISGVEVEVEGGRWVVDVVEEVRDEDDEQVGKKGGYRIGEWRRRRWVRMVERIILENKEGD